MALRRALGNTKRAVARVLRRAFVHRSLPLEVQTFAIRRLLPMDPWPRSLAYQQCLADRILAAQGQRCQSGPFAGMVCLEDAEEGCLVPKLLGCYEEELSGIIESMIAAGYDRVVDVGCASGYWLTGLALRLPAATLVGFELDVDARARCAKMVAQNGVDTRVDLRGRCTVRDLEQAIEGRTLVFMDCDGPEFELLDPALAPALKVADVLVETHDYLNPAISSTLIERFDPTHKIESVSSREREASSERYPGLATLPQAHWAEALAERRPCVQEWLIMRSRLMQATRATS